MAGNISFCYICYIIESYKVPKSMSHTCWGANKCLFFYFALEMKPRQVYLWSTGGYHR